MDKTFSKTETKRDKALETERVTKRRRKDTDTGTGSTEPWCGEYGKLPNEMIQKAEPRYEGQGNT